MSDYNEGDLVEAVKGTTVLRGRLKRSREDGPDPILVLTPALKSDIVHLALNGYTVTVIERAKPALPTAIGSVIRIWREPASPGWTYELGEHGYWWGTDHAKYTPTDLDGILRSYGPSFDVLESVADTAGTVLDYVRAHGTTSRSHEYNGLPIYEVTEVTLRDIAERLGVQL